MSIVLERTTILPFTSLKKIIQWKLVRQLDRRLEKDAVVSNFRWLDYDFMSDRNPYLSRKFILKRNQGFGD